MSTISRTQQGTLDFFNRRIADWTANAEVLELGPDDLATLSALLATAQTNFDAAKQLEDDYRAAIDLQDEAIDALYNFGSLLVQQIRVAARKEGTDTLYALAKIDPPKKPSTRTEAPIPTDLVTSTTTSGDVVLSFEGSKAGGVLFEVQRQLQPIAGQPGGWAHVATIGQKEFVDTAVPSGLAAVSYRVRTQLTTGVLSQWSYPAPFYFGNGNQAAAAPRAAQSAAQSVQAESAPEPDGGESLTIEDAQALKDAQTAKGADKAG